MGLAEHSLQTIRNIKILHEKVISLCEEHGLKDTLDIKLFDKHLYLIKGIGLLEGYFFNIIRSVNEPQKPIYYQVRANPFSESIAGVAAYNVSYEDILSYFEKWFNLILSLLRTVKTLDSAANNESLIKKIEFHYTFLENIYLKSFQFLDKIQLNELTNKKEIYILGENGDGKTVLLQAFLLAFKEHFVKNMARKSLVGEFLDFDNDFKEATYEVELEDKTILSKANMGYHSNVYAYGTNRGNILSETEDEYGFMTLFSPRYHLRNPVDWLVDLRGKELELKSKANEENQDTESKETQNILTLETAKRLLEDIINSSKNLKDIDSSKNPKDIDIEVDLSTKEKVVFKERNTKIKFEHLSEGYRSVFIWVADLVSRLAESQPKVKQIQDFKGIVLVDEINLHLHPKWEIQIVQKLRSWFPNIQFFFTTHSPICILGASEDAVFYRLYKENGVAQLSEQIEYSQIKEMTANQVVTSMLFDLETPFMKHTDSSEIDTSDDYLYNRIHKKISQRLEKRKKEGEVYFSDEEINAMIDEALNDEIE